MEIKRYWCKSDTTTVKGKKMLDLVERVDKDHLVDLVALPKLVRFAEKQEFNSDEVLAYLKKIF